MSSINFSEETKIFHIAILSAMQEEIGKALDHLFNIKKNKFGDLTIYSGIWNGSNEKFKILITLAWSGWGKVSAARAATRIISSKEQKKVDLLLFIGVAGAATKELEQWDVVIADSVVQHDMDARPHFPRFYIPIANQSNLFPDLDLVNIFYKSLQNPINTKKLNKLRKIYKGLIGSGDSFISDQGKLLELKESLPKLLAVEMEGAAVAQVCYQENIAWSIIRVISDSADENAESDFLVFINEYKLFSWKLIEILLETIKVNVIE